MKSILMVEDNSHKRQKVLDYILELLPDANIDVAHSFSSGGKLATENRYDMILLDISLPTYDKTENDTGGRNRAFGGHEIARKIIRRKIHTKIIFITQFDSFSDQDRSHSIDSLEELLKNDCGDNYIGLVRYDSSKYSWKEQLGELLGRI
ncbi:TPA: response regulator [Enterobacter bugandensis]|uniref:response regulator n=1 Tax=Enterobacter bugandensis TaxID=881260 RepID=UPI0032FCA16E|nr:response regulator [Enterobacter bugandensis]HDR2592644.1 response regulator [Enterobacter bugandensis]